MGGSRKPLILSLFCLILLQCVRPAFASLAFTINQVSDVAITAPSYAATGTLDLTLGFVPIPGQNLTVVKNTGPDFISGNFDAVPQGASVLLTFNGVSYPYIANYFGGNGRSLVLQWPLTGIAALGSNQYGQLGNRGISDQTSPVAVLQRGVMAGAVITQIDAGMNHTLALSADSRIFSWGDNAAGQLGDGGTQRNNVPVAVDRSGALAGKTVVAVSGGGNFSLALDSGGLVYAWGQNSSGNLGIGGTTGYTNPSSVPVAVDTSGVLNGKTLTAIAAGNSHALALSSEGKVYAWGSNSPGALGNNYANNTFSGCSVPVAVDTSGVLAGKTIVAIDAGYHASLALSADGQVFSWGYNSQQGNGSITGSPVPVALSTSGALAGKTIVAIALSDYSYNGLALDSDGEIYTWGFNIASANGTVGSSGPVEVNTGSVLDGKTVVSISGRYSRCTVTTSDGMVYKWQQDATSGGLVPVVAGGDLADRFVSAITGGDTHSVELMNAGPPGILQQPWARTLAQGQTATFTAKAGKEFPSTVKWQISQTGPAGPFTDIIGNPTATTNTLALDGVSASQNGHAFRAVFSNASGSRASQPATLSVVNWSATFTSMTHVPFSGDAITAGGVLDLQLGFDPTPGADFTVIRNRGTDFISGTFANVPQGGTISLTYNSVSYPYVADYYAGNGRSLVLHWPRTRLMAWGNNEFGKLGTGDSSQHLIPAEVATPAAIRGKVTKLAASGGSFSMALTAEGQLFTWGNNSYGRLGTNAVTPYMPTEVTEAGALAGKKVVDISASGHCLALTSEGRVYAWGLNSDRQLGTGNTGYSVSSPAELAPEAFDGQPVVAVSAGMNHSMALTADGRVFSWGSNSSGKTGNGATTWYTTAPTEVITSENLNGLTIVAIAAGDAHSLALTSDGRLFAWGDSGYIDGSSSAAGFPRPISMTGALTGKTVTQIDAQSHSLVLTTAGNVIGWGSNYYGQLGTGTTVDSLLPTTINGGALAGKIVSSITCSGLNSAGTSTDGGAFTWGRNDSGQLGDGTTFDKTSPVAVATLGGANGLKAISMAAGGSHTLALVEAGPPRVTTQPSNCTAAAGTAVTMTAGATDPFGYDVRWQVSTSGPAGPFTDVLDNATAATPTLVIGNVTAAQNQWAWRAIFSNTSGSVTTTPAVLNLVTWSGSLDSITNIPNQAANPVVGGPLGLQLNFAPAPGTSLTVLHNSGLSFIAGTFDDIPQGGRITLSFGGVSYDFIANYFGDNGRSLVLQWPWMKIASWGSDSVRQLGVTPQGNRNSPTATTFSGAPGDTVWTTTATGSLHSMTLSSDGRVFSWGNNIAGQLGNGNTVTPGSMVAANTNDVLEDQFIVAVSGGSDHTLALSSTGQVFAWGHNGYGQLGDNTETTRSTPAAVATNGTLEGKSVVAIAAGRNSSVALTTDGKLHAWGYNYNGELGNGTYVSRTSTPLEVNTSGALFGKTVTTIAAGAYHTLALTSDGRVYSWGYNSSGQLGNNSTTPSNVPLAISGTLAGKTVVAIAAGERHSMALTSDGLVFTWGGNNYGEIGDKSTIPRPAPVLAGIGSPLSGQNVVRISAGDSYCLAQSSDGKLFSWGLNDTGQLGVGTTINSSFPVQVNAVGFLAGRSISNLKAGGSHVITHFSGDGLPVVTGNPKNRSVIQSGSPGPPVTFSAEATDLFPLAVRWQVSPTGSSGPFSDITDNASASTAKLTLPGDPQSLDGSAYRAVFTNNNGIVTTTAATLEVNTISASFNFASVADTLATAAVTDVSGGLDLSLSFAPAPGTDLTVIRNTGPSFISGSFSNLPHGATISLAYSGITHSFIVDYFGGHGRSLVLHWANTFPAAWGYGSSGQVGAGNYTSINRTPVAVLASGALAGETLVKLAAGTNHSLALASSGRIFAWGANSFGKLGNGTTVASNVPVLVDITGILAGKRVVSIAAGDAHSLALTADGQVAAWGSNAYGQLGNGGPSVSFTAIAVARDGELASKTVTAVAAGLFHNVALVSDGTLIAWGANSSGQLGNGNKTNAGVPVAVLSNGALAGKTVIAIAAGASHTLALTADGRVFSWGSNVSGQLGYGSSSPSSSSSPAAISGGGLIAGNTVVAIAAGANHSLAVTSDGKVYAWGNGASGALSIGASISYSPAAVNTSGVLAGKSVVAIAAGGRHSLAIGSDGLGYAWGGNDYGQLGDNNFFIPTYSPVAMSTLGAIGSRPLAAIAAGGSHSLAIAGRGTAPTVTQAPVSQTIGAGGTVTLTAAADGYPAPSVRWQRSTTGPGGSFTNLSGQTAPTLELANITSSQTGYAYRAVFTNLEAIVNSAAASLTVQATFENFLVSRGLPVGAAPTDDPFYTEIPHLLAFAFDLNPSSPDRAKLPIASSIGGQFRISYTRWRNAPGLRYTVEVSDGLDHWISGPNVTEIVSVTSLNNARETVVEQVTLQSPTSSRFIRVRVELEPH